MKKTIYILISICLLMGVYATINIVNLNITADQKIIDKLDNLGLHNLTYKGRCDYKECHVAIYANRINKANKIYLGEYTFLTEGLTNQDKKDKMESTFNEYFLYRIEGSEKYEGYINLT